MQTPQGFERRLLTDAYRRAFEEGFYGTDDAVLVERTGHRVRIVEGDYGNIKITTREDLPMEYRTGTGFDVHAFAEDRQLVLGGVLIPYEKGLAGHSDADVLVHAVMDALLGAAALGGYRQTFPGFRYAVQRNIEHDPAVTCQTAAGGQFLQYRKYRCYCHGSGSEDQSVCRADEKRHCRGSED